MKPNKPEQKIRPPECVFCGAPWTDEMMQIEDIEASEGCDTCGYGQGISGTVVITCSTCERVVYKKEFNCDYL